jgi:hypothetical protein
MSETAIDDEYLDCDDGCISSWDDSSAHRSDSKNQSYKVQSTSGRQKQEIDSLKNLFKFTAKSSKDRKTRKLIEAAWKSIQKFDATYEKVSRMQCERVLFPGSHGEGVGEDEADEDQEVLDIAEDADSEVEIDFSTSSPTEDSKAFDDDDHSSSSGSDCGDDEEIDPAMLKQHKKFLLLVAQRTDEFLRAHAGLTPSPPSAQHHTPHLPPSQQAHLPP